MRYHLTTAPLGLAAAEEFAEYLSRYAIAVAGLTVQHEDSQGRYHNDRTAMVAISTQLAPLASGTVGGTAGAAAAGLGCAPLLAPLAALVAPILPVAIPALLVGNAVNGRAMAAYERKWGGAARPDIVASHITFTLANVSPDRLKWAEYLIAVYAQRHGWSLQGLRHDTQWAAAARAARIPVPWSQQPAAPRCARPVGKAQQRRSTVRNRLAAWWTERNA